MLWVTRYINILTVIIEVTYRFDPYQNKMVFRYCYTKIIKTEFSVICFNETKKDE